HFTGVSVKSEKLLTTSRVPNLHLTLGMTIPVCVPDAAATGETIAVGTEANADNRPAVACQGVQQLPRARFPDFDGPVLAGTGETLAVGGKADAVHISHVPIECAQLLAGRSIPYLDFTENLHAKANRARTIDFFARAARGRRLGSAKLLFAGAGTR